MKLLSRAIFLFSLFGLLVAAQGQKAPNTFVLDGDHILQNKLKAEEGSQKHQLAIRKLAEAGDKLLSRKPYTIVDKTKTPPSGDKHDYLSLSTYWWPNPLTPNGLPYVPRDGQTNPEIKLYKDNAYIVRLSKDIELLGLAYYFTQNEKYAKKATELLCVFFLDKSTKMNPNLNHSSIIPGLKDGRPEGIIDSQLFVKLIDGVQLLAGSKSWTPENHSALQDWFSQYADWMLNSRLGKAAHRIVNNNIGTYYDLQIVSYTLFSGNKSLAKSHLQQTTLRRIGTQFEADGSQPFELKRTRSWTYCIKNLQAWCALASAAEKAGVNIWTYETNDGKSLKKGFLWMLPYAEGNKSWSHQEINGVKLEWFAPLAKIAFNVYKDPQFHSYLSSKSAQAADNGPGRYFLTRQY